MGNKVTTADNLMQIEFESHITPVILSKTNKDYLSWGLLNNHPNYLLELYKRDSFHGSIIKYKSDHIYGKGLCYDDSLSTLEKAQYENFLSKANRYEDWNSVFRKNCTPFEIFDGIALQIIYGMNGKIVEVYNQEFAKFRLSPDGKKVFYCDQWYNDNPNISFHPEKHSSYKEYPIFNPNIRTGTQIMYFKTENMTAFEYGNIYPEPNYIQICQDIETNIEITNFHYSNLKNGMFAAAMLSLFNGEPDETKKKQYIKMFERKFSGTSNTGKLLFNFVNQGGQKAELTTLTQADLDKMFEQVAERVKESIIIGHRIDPDLVGIITKSSTAIGDNTVYLQKFDRWIKSYVEHRQQIHLDIIRTISEVNGIDLSKLEVEQKNPASISLPYDFASLSTLFDKETLTKYYSKQLGIEILNPVDTTAQPIQQEGQIKEKIKNITGKQWIQIKRLIREVQNGKTSKESAAMLLKNSYGLNDTDIETLFIKPDSAFKSFSNVADDEIFAMFEAAAIDDNDDEIVKEDFVNNKLEALEKENKFFAHRFTNPYENVAALKKAIIDMTSGNPFIRPSEIAKQLNIPLDVIEKTISILAIAKLLDISEGSIQPTEAAIAKDIAPVETEVYTVYKYVTRPDVPEAESSRQFCKKMLALTRNGKTWTREALDSLSNQFGEDAWSYRGGFYTNPNTNETTPYCRHVWKSVIKVRKKEKK